MTDYGIGGLVTGFKVLFVLCCIFIPLGLWKAIEIFIWVYKNVSITFG